MGFDNQQQRFTCDRINCEKTATLGHKLCFKHHQQELLKPAQKTEATQ